MRIGTFQLRLLGPCLLAAAAVIGPAGCRMAEPVSSAKATPPASAPSAAAQKAPDLPEDSAPAALVSGFDLAGPVTCLPLGAASTCLTRTDAVATACAAAHGDVLKCEDCSVLCSKAVGRGR